MLLMLAQFQLISIDKDSKSPLVFPVSNGAGDSVSSGRRFGLGCACERGTNSGLHSLSASAYFHYVLCLLLPHLILHREEEYVH